MITKLHRFLIFCYAILYVYISDIFNAARNQSILLYYFSIKLYLKLYFSHELKSRSRIFNNVYDKDQQKRNDYATGGDVYSTVTHIDNQLYIHVCLRSSRMSMTSLLMSKETLDSRPGTLISDKGGSDGELCIPNLASRADKFLKTRNFALDLSTYTVKIKWKVFLITVMSSRLNNDTGTAIPHFFHACSVLFH